MMPLQKGLLRLAQFDHSVPVHVLMITLVFTQSFQCGKLYIIDMLHDMLHHQESTGQLIILKAEVRS